MRAFTYERPADTAAALRAIAKPGAKFLAGGTNLLDLMKVEAEVPQHLVDGVRRNSCLNLAVACEGREIVTIEGLGHEQALHPMQAAFVKHDGFQCGYCTPGQICSAVGMLAEIRKRQPSAVTANLSATAMPLAEDEVRERMSGNICRCAAYPNIVAAILDAAGKA